MQLLTFHGTLLAQDLGTGALTQIPFGVARDGVIPVEVDLPAVAMLRERYYPRYICNQTAGEDVPIASGPLEGFVAHVEGDGRTLTVTRGTCFLAAEAPRWGAGVKADRRQASGWETFIPLSTADRENLSWIMSEDWVVEHGRDHEIVPATRLHIEDGFMLRLGRLRADLRLHVPFRTLDKPFRFIALQEGWRIQQAFAYRPLMLFCSFGAPEVMDQLYLSLQSLIEFGRYDGPILIITDRSKDLILSKVPALQADKVMVEPHHPKDFVGYVASKYLVAESEVAQDRQPILFNDPDIVFDSDIDRMLMEVASSRAIAAPIEDFSQLRLSPSVGSTLIQRHGGDTRFACGFNAGTLGIPNLRDHRRSLLLIRDIMVNHAQRFGRREHEWVDQETANYVAHCLGPFDTYRLTPFVRWGWNGVERDVEGRRGIVHFWPWRRPEDKRERMAMYISNLRKGAAVADGR